MEKIAAQADAISEAGRQLVEKVDELLADAMAEANEITIRRAPVNILALISEVINANRPLAEKKEQKFAVAMPARSEGDVRPRPPARGFR